MRFVIIRSSDSFVRPRKQPHPEAEYAADLNRWTIEVRDLTHLLEIASQLDKELVLAHATASHGLPVIEVYDSYRE